MEGCVRADQLIVQRGLAPTRSAAQRLIGRGAVRWRRSTGDADASWSTMRKSGEDVPEACELQVTDDAELRWASRAGLKLEAALKACGLDVSGHCCLDVGQSTGGFTDVLLHAGAARVVGIDVGHGQLLPRLRDDRRVIALEGLNARHLRAADLGEAMPAGGFELITGDLSFISLTAVLAALRPLLAARGRLLMLVKPQFELQPGQIGKGGLVRDERLYAEVEQRLRAAAIDAGLEPDDWFESPIRGGDGNREFFLSASLADASADSRTVCPEATEDAARAGRRR